LILSIYNVIISTEYVTQYRIRWEGDQECCVGKDSERDIHSLFVSNIPAFA